MSRRCAQSTEALISTISKNQASQPNWLLISNNAPWLSPKAPIPLKPSPPKAIPPLSSHQARKIDKSVLTIGQPKRIRCKEHLRYVASQPCAICGRTPSHAHHVRYAQSRGLGLKVSDEFTVPLCAIHHRDIHDTTKEREWWQERKIDPLIIARALWNESQKHFASTDPAGSGEVVTKTESTLGPEAAKATASPSS